MSARLTINDDVSAILDRDGAVILDTRAGKYYSLNRVAADVWRGIEAGHSLDDVVADLASRYDQTRDNIAGDVNALVASLQRLGLVGAN